ncbi:hypothetical protein DF105_03695 [Burkholderia stagnalis]|nr:hypothetical protein DF164_16645 [Burkholderia stagnalis]RQQ35651.1 hypothetical protein DF148_13955 [Burkholderia stagnalis]RQY27541.1 hypothetical protein DF117_00650 [Burkholderia stagnalis]RQY43870.1 hypothetical protein DF113_08695 [Burkholderia stagnalis]RQY60672.1 hypothetical protein DF111_00655 [Burkholderia stagnalis]
MHIEFPHNQTGDTMQDLIEGFLKFQREEFGRSPACPVAHHHMKLDAATFRKLRRLAPVLDDVLNAGEVEHADQAVNLAALAALCSQLFDAYRGSSVTG